MFGTVLGSFANSIAYRIKYNKPIALDRSECPKCHNKIAFYDLIPIVSFFILRGKCRHCKQKISWHYPLIEFLSGIYLTIICILYTNGDFDSWELLIYIAFGITLFIIIVSDILYLEIPNSMQIIIILIAISRIFIDKENAIPFFVSAIFAAGLFYFVFKITGSNKMGLGDVKLAFGLGLFFGFFQFIWIVVISSLAGILLGIAISQLNKLEIRKVKVPYGSVITLTSLLFFIASFSPSISNYLNYNYFTLLKILF